MYEKRVYKFLKNVLTYSYSPGGILGTESSIGGAHSTGERGK